MDHIQLGPARDEGGVEEVLGELGVPLGHLPTRAQSRRRRGLEELRAEPVVPVEPVFLGYPPRNLQARILI